MQRAIPDLRVQDKVPDLVSGREAAVLVWKTARDEDGQPVALPDASSFAPASIVRVEPLALFVVQAAVVRDVSRIEQRWDVWYAERIPYMPTAVDLDLQTTRLFLDRFLIHRRDPLVAIKLRWRDTLPVVYYLPTDHTSSVKRFILQNPKMDKTGQQPDEEEGFLVGDPIMDNLNRFMRSIRQQDDRAMVLSLAAFAEDTLGRLLLAYMVDCKQAKELVEGFNAPLGTVSSRIKAAYAIGLLLKAQHDDLDIARKIRNRFAHDWEGVTLESNDIQALIGQLRCHTLKSHKKPFEGSPRERLIEAISTICVETRIHTAGLVSGKNKRIPVVGFRLRAGEVIADYSENKDAPA